MNDEHSLMACSAISHNAQQCFSAVAEYLTEPSAIYRPALAVDGNQWCALYGKDLQTGIAGFGDSPEAAMCDFNRNWRTPLPSSPSGIAMAEKIAAKTDAMVAARNS
ncbi:hypothetical protein [Pseudomonas sp. Irchel 3A5]|uniref:hypothetical protein n=1 Tax=Pseudomonas sp. Irchel 3A5 TaxID=2008911 RepID=UPI000BA2EA38|nr:hypothetical protein [Pseudomonas sp. Irchel 3A5]